MPEIALQNGEKVFPSDVSSDARVTCLICGGEMVVRSAHYRNGKRISRVFAHIDKSDCAGESPVHELMKAQAVKSLQLRFPEAHVTDEVKIGDNHIADVVCTFNTPKFPLGNGVVVEAQYKNKDKDFKATVSDFTGNGYSVYWAYWPDFKSDEWMEICEDRFVKTWPTAAPPKPGLDGYDECVHAFFEHHGYGEGRVPLTLPTPVAEKYMRVHELNFVPPSAISDMDFHQRGKKWLHAKGERVVWGKLFQSCTKHRSVEWVLEMTRLDKTTEEMKSITVHVDNSDVEAFYSFADKLGELNDSEALFCGTDSREILAVTPIGLHTPHGAGTLKLVNTPDKGVCIEFTWGDMKANTYSLQVEYRDGDGHRFKNICGLLYGVIEKNN